MQLANPENKKELLELLAISETANDSFNALIDYILDAVQKCNLVKIKSIIEDDGFSSTQAILALKTMIIASGNDQRIIRLADILLDNSGISRTEAKILNTGEVILRKVYFIRRDDGAIKIGSTLDINRRIKEISSQAGDIELLLTIDGTIALETKLHKYFSKNNIHNEWFIGEEVERFIAEWKEKQSKVELPLI